MKFIFSFLTTFLKTSSQKLTTKEISRIFINMMVIEERRHLHSCNSLELQASTINRSDWQSYDRLESSLAFKDP